MLHDISAPLAKTAAGSSPASKRLRRWLESVIAAKRSRALEDPELFATYVQLAGEAREVIAAHVHELVGQLTRIIADGAKRGEFAVDDPETAARAVFDATGRFHNPAHASEWSEPGIDAAFGRVFSLLAAASPPATDGPLADPATRPVHSCEVLVLRVQDRLAQPLNKGIGVAPALQVHWIHPLVEQRYRLRTIMRVRHDDHTGHARLTPFV